MDERMKLKVNTGVVTIDVENEHGTKIGEFDFNPTDSGILERYKAVVDFFNNVDIKEMATEDEQCEEIIKLENEIREQFNYLLGYDVAPGIFGRCGALTTLKSGKFYFENVLEGIGSLVSEAVAERTKAKLQRIAEATAIYNEK